MSIAMWNQFNQRFAELEARIVELESAQAVQPIPAEAVTEIQPPRRGRPPKDVNYGNS